MLSELYIENFAVIEKMNISLDTGLTVFTGETGAGKSILIDAINLVLGQRSSKEIVRTGAKKAVVYAKVQNITPQIEKLINRYGFESEENSLIFKREIYSDGRSSARIMDKPVMISTLREIGARLVNIHGQHDNQVLLNSENHIDILDLFAENKAVFLRYNAEYDKYVALKNEYKKVSLDEDEKKRKIDLLTYEINEISQLNLQKDEDIALQTKIKSCRNAEKIMQNLKKAYNSLAGFASDGAVDLVNEAARNVSEVSEFNKTLADVSERLESAEYELDDIKTRISAFMDNFYYDKNELEQMTERLDSINKLKRKYGNSIEDVLEYCEQSKNQLDEIKLSEKRQKELLSLMDVQKNNVVETAKKLTVSRKVGAQNFSKQVADELKFLDMPNIQLSVSINNTRYSKKGCDEVEFLFSTNKGEPPKSIGKIASGGELSRIMLAIKSVLAQKDDIDTLIFDEIDTGVSGSSAQKIGLKLKGVSKGRQVLCVTHSAQIAALADNNMLLKKETIEDKTYTKAIKLDEEQKIHEVARIMSTDTVTELMLQNAKEMVEMGRNTN